MGKMAYKRLKGWKQFRQRLVLATLSGIPILVEDIRPDETPPGLRPHEVSLLRLVETISDQRHGDEAEVQTRGGDGREAPGPRLWAQPLHWLFPGASSRALSVREEAPLHQAQRSPGYGISLVAETTSGCLISSDTAVCYTQEDMECFEDSEKKSKLSSPEGLAVEVASMLLGEIKQGGVVDSTHQGLLFLLCALCPQDVSKVRVGKLTPCAMETLCNIRDFFDVKFAIKPEPMTNTVMLKYVGCGLKNLSRKIS